MNAGYVFEELNFDPVRFQFGGRFDYQTADAEADPKFGPAASRGFATGGGSAGVVYTFLGWMVGGAAAAVVLAIAAVWVWWLVIFGPIVFIAATAYGAWYFISQALGRGDHKHTVEDYKAGRVPGQTT